MTDTKNRGNEMRTDQELIDGIETLGRALEEAGVPFQLSAIIGKVVKVGFNGTPATVLLCHEYAKQEILRAHLSYTVLP